MKKEVIILILKGHLKITLLIFAVFIAIIGFFPNNIIAYCCAFIFTWMYWSFEIPKYKLYCIEKLKTKEEYFIWNNAAVNTGLFWPTNFFLSFTEFWYANDEYKYNKVVNQLLSE